MSYADLFGKLLKKDGRVPSLDDKETWEGFLVEDVVMSRRFGAWKITQVIFKDGSYYNVGQPDQGAHSE